MTTPAVPGLPVSDAVAGPILLQNYANTQQTIAARAALAIYNLWMRLIDPLHFDDSWRTLNPIVTGIMSTHYDMTAANAAQYYGLSRVVAGNPYMAVPGQEPDEQYMNKVANIMGRGQFYHFLKEQEPDAASAMANDSLRGASTRMVLMGGRDTVTATATQDPMAKGWERVIEPGACGFCAMLASRGAVYKESTADFRAHDHCKCVARAVFIGEPSVNKDLQKEWATATKGTKGKASIAAWNQYWENRNVDTGARNSAGTPAIGSQGPGDAGLIGRVGGSAEIPNP